MTTETLIPSNQNKLRLSRKWFNPLYFIINEIIKDNTIRTVLIYGGKSSSKTVSITQILTKETFIKHSNAIAFRKEGTLIQTTLKKSFQLAINSMRLNGGFDTLQFMFRCLNGAEIVLKGLDDPEKAKGIESYKYVYLDELNHFEKEEYEQFDLSLRGIEGQKLFASWNPVSETSWVKKDLVDTIQFEETYEFGTLPDENSSVKISADRKTVLIKTTYKDNYWTVGSPDGTYGYIDHNLIHLYESYKTRNYNIYRVNVLGEWGKIRTGGEFFNQFDESKHVGEVKYQPGVIWVSLDENVNPYVTETIWQMQGRRISQIHEILCKTPNNNAPKAAAKFCDWLDSIKHGDMVFVCGDPSASKRSTVDINSSSFYDKFIEVVKQRGYRVTNKVMKSAPEVALSAAFINEIYETNLYSYEIMISSSCTGSIEDYAIVKEDAEGKMQKVKEKDKVTGVTYEPHGHCSDTKRYLVLTMLADQFRDYKNPKHNSIRNQLGYFR